MSECLALWHWSVLQSGTESNYPNLILVATHEPNFSYTSCSNFSCAHAISKEKHLYFDYGVARREKFLGLNALRMVSECVRE